MAVESVLISITFGVESRLDTSVRRSDIVTVVALVDGWFVVDLTDDVDFL